MSVSLLAEYSYMPNASYPEAYLDDRRSFSSTFSLCNLVKQNKIGLHVYNSVELSMFWLPFISVSSPLDS